MEPKPLLKRLAPLLWAAGGLLLVLILVGMVVDYPDWLEHLITNILLIGLGLVNLFNAARLRNKDRKSATVFLIAGIVLIVFALLTYKWIKIIAIIGLVVFLLTNRTVRNIINKSEAKESK